jgi:hypothetical protein
MSTLRPANGNRNCLMRYNDNPDTSSRIAVPGKGSACVVEGEWGAGWS